MKKIILATLFALAAPFASATVFFQSNAATDSGAHSDFDTASFTFAPEYVDTITIANTGSGYGHNHGGPAQGLLEIYDGTNWTIVDQFVLGSHALFSSVFANPVTFTGEVISGLRLTETSSVGNAYHSVNPSMTYTTSGTPSNVPEPASIALLGLGLFGFAVARRKSTK